jgi:formate-dependent nitrite reductase cytochrome c552 subunit
MKVEEAHVRNRLVIILILATVVLITICNLSTVHLVVAAEIQSIDCTGCHSMTMERHRFPTSPCKSCHSSDMATLTLRDGTVIHIEESDPLCAQCHKEIFQAWIEGKHGAVDSKCAACHNPHSEDRVSPKIEASSLFSLLLQIAAVSGTFIAVILIERIGEKTRMYE